jgi:class 3 adenylate cyclase
MLRRRTDRLPAREGLKDGHRGAAVGADEARPVAVAAAARISAHAGAGEVLVSTTVKDLVAGPGLHFEERGVKSLKGVPGDWPLFQAIDDDPG